VKYEFDPNSPDSGGGSSGGREEYMYDNSISLASKIEIRLNLIKNKRRRGETSSFIVYKALCFSGNGISL
jgi:hypothetical protein